MTSTKSHRWMWPVVVAGTFSFVALLSVRSQSVSEPQQAAGAVTFAKDVAPILQQKCQVCHQPNSIGPMSLLTYEDARKYARRIKTKVSDRLMPPWHIDKTVGIQQFKNDRSLTDREVDTIVRWVDEGTAAGDPKDMPPAIDLRPSDEWQFAPLYGKPDLVIKSPSYTLAARTTSGSGPCPTPASRNPDGFAQSRSSRWASAAAGPSTMC